MKRKVADVLKYVRSFC